MYQHHNVLTLNQRGFRKFRSCETQLISLIDGFSKGLDNYDILLDFSNTFDKNHYHSLRRNF